MTDATSSPSRSDLLQNVRRVYEKTDGPVRPRDINNDSPFDYEDYEEEFGSLIFAKIKAGLLDIELPDEDPDSNYQISNEELLQELLRIYEITGKTPSIRDMKMGGKYSATAYTYRFGSWNEALEATGFQTRESSVDAEAIPKREKHYTNADWKRLREKAIERDDGECQRCGIDESSHQQKYGVGLNVHHIRDIVEFDDPDEADKLSNLETLCVKCHGKKHPLTKS